MRQPAHRETHTSRTHSTRDQQALATVNDLRLLQRRDAREHLALEQLERRAAAGRDVRHLVSQAGLLDSRDGVTTANDGLAVAQLLLDHLRGLGAVVEAHPTLWDGVHTD